LIFDRFDCNKNVTELSLKYGNLVKYVKKWNAKNQLIIKEFYQNTGERPIYTT
jgi:hypothetical protein